MIPRAVIQAWANVKPWPTLIQVEQDLVLARLIVEITEHPLLGEELVFRGGTCLHQLVLDRPRRYSEDLDYVRTTLRAKLKDAAFRNDLNALVADWPEGYDIDEAAELVIAEVLSKT